MEQKNTIQQPWNVTSLNCIVNDKTTSDRVENCATTDEGKTLSLNAGKITPTNLPQLP